MSVIYVLLAISITVAVVFFIAFVFSVKSGQYDDTYTPSVRMLFEDEVIRNKDKSNSNKKEIKQTKSTNQ
ncbi:MAG: cbb3-type cytochrome oxidase assembly protein CcoS [Allomuricauda sp.]|jgi:cbb3-type cytochrome oxidase maturation protein|uniref:Cbb3-type cytochrome oxidase assembly protein CcoS n=1 Tax=Flagellimonas sp. MMG031 TaxID=3158549 RepID=A0AAU7N077_9FLAO|nr:MULTISPECIES: cbb3-type cytochrome oxidase assembly protein CcoS [unclassified Allomuricauda]MBO6532664.1 cbb3-type cytochrome oxidase assembly protein CcoS [Allomuricauda sp.]MBO6589983.1 cbb3-type cytochrome oxidase assembly protein CcoS [Allomuricauda sp.]MBO6619609.1 cbb3-type cytochrome oxidase assembly protein CcoS [Allomuricauda sp.]MBO6645422.1 cbb3-type cytochrome oxidase assembly protein CcoS [Allomuricauda sp.]MBO6747630.1 cbb3-type cytochrome oxidase assembly protein CcoS [Allom